MAPFTTCATSPAITTNATLNLSSNHQCQANIRQVADILYLTCTCLSLFVCVLAFFIYISIRNKMIFTDQPDRDTTKHWIHFNFIISFILRDLMVTTILSLNESEFPFSSVQARIFMRYAFSTYCVIANFYWMFMEALWLFIGVQFPVYSKQITHTKVKTFLMGWLTPALLVSIWTFIGYCDPYTQFDFFKAPGIVCIMVPIYLILLLNLGMMIGVLDILRRKLISEPEKIYRLIRATVLLSLLLGINFLISMAAFPFLTNLCHVQIARLINDPASALQGSFVAIFYVLRNEEILETIQRHFPRRCFRKRDSRSRAQRSSSGSRFWSLITSLTTSTGVKSTTDCNDNTYQPCQAEPEADNHDEDICEAVMIV